MAKARPSVQKRKKEARALEKRQAKAAKKAARSAEREESGGNTLDAALEGIVAGPQVIAWHEDGDGEGEGEGEGDES